MLQFDKETTALFNETYRGRDFVERRLANLQILDPKSAEHIVDIGCGNGMLTAELARAVGPEGRVFGVDPSDDMRQSARENCSSHDIVRIVDGAADRMPLEDESVDKAVSIQVFEYLSDIPAALREAYRILRPGGRLVIGDMHFGTLAWHSENPDRMRRILSAYSSHFTTGDVPARLPGLLKDSGFRFERSHPHTIVDTSLRPDGLAKSMMGLVSNYATGNNLVPQSDVREWLAEQENLAKSGRFHFVFTHIITSAIKPNH